MLEDGAIVRASQEQTKYSFIGSLRTFRHTSSETAVTLLICCKVVSRVNKETIMTSLIEDAVYGQFFFLLISESP